MVLCNECRKLTKISSQLVDIEFSGPVQLESPRTISSITSTSTMARIFIFVTRKSNLKNKIIKDSSIFRTEIFGLDEGER